MLQISECFEICHIRIPSGPSGQRPYPFWPYGPFPDRGNRPLVPKGSLWHVRSKKASPERGGGSAEPSRRGSAGSTNSPKAFAFRSSLPRPLRRFAPAPLKRGAFGGRRADFYCFSSRRLQFGGKTDRIERTSCAQGAAKRKGQIMYGTGLTAVLSGRNARLV